MFKQLLLRNCRRYDTPTQSVDILIVDGKIRRIESTIDQTDTDAEIIDANRAYVAPGFIDVHIQGAGGFDILDAKPEGLKTISRTLAKFGVTGILATTVFQTDHKNEHLKLIAQTNNKDLGGAHILGVHLEGPFINPAKKGGISENCILPASQYELAHIFDITGKRLKMMTIAPELPGNLKIIERLANQQIIASFGHSNASYEETQRGIKAGICHVTHFFNAMPALHHRSPGPIPAIIENQRISVQLIADGVHLHPAIIRGVYQCISSDRIICITDGIQAIGMPEGRYVYNGRDYISKDGAARYLDGTLIGTALPLNQIARRFKEFTHCTLQQAVDTVSFNPVRLLGLENQKGSIAIGKDADLVIMDQDFNVDMTIINGKIVHRHS